MAPKTKSIPLPAGYHSVNCYLTVQGAARLLDFLKGAFGAVETERITGKNGEIRHAEVRIGDSIVMMGDAPDPSKARPGSLYLYLDDVDAAYHSALAAGAKSISEPTDQFYGDRSAGVEDPCGNYWYVATHFEDVAPDELQRRMAALAAR